MLACEFIMVACKRMRASGEMHHTSLRRDHALERQPSGAARSLLAIAAWRPDVLPEVFAD